MNKRTMVIIAVLAMLIVAAILLAGCDGGDPSGVATMIKAAGQPY